MGRFFGSYNRSLDSKGRLLIPVKLLSPGVTSFYVLRGFDGCVAVYEQDEFDKLVASLEAMDYNDERQRAYVRLVSASIVKLPLDSHNRVNLTQPMLREYGIGQEVVLIGVLDHFEIWDSLAYSAYQLANSGSLNNPYGGYHRG